MRILSIIGLLAVDATQPKKKTAILCRSSAPTPDIMFVAKFAPKNTAQVYDATLRTKQACEVSMERQTLKTISIETIIK